MQLKLVKICVAAINGPNRAKPPRSLFREVGAKQAYPQAAMDLQWPYGSHDFLGEPITTK